MGKLLLVDGSNLLFQIFYGMPAHIVEKNGKLIHGTLGFVGVLLKIINELPFSLEKLRFTYEGQKTGEVLSAIGLK